MTLPEWVTHSNLDVIAVVLLALVLVLAINGVRDHFDRKFRKRDQRTAALRGDDPYAADWDWRKNRAS